MDYTTMMDVAEALRIGEEKGKKKNEELQNEIERLLQLIDEAAAIAAKGDFYNAWLMLSKEQQRWDILHGKHVPHSENTMESFLQKVHEKRG